MSAETTITGSSPAESDTLAPTDERSDVLSFLDAQYDHLVASPIGRILITDAAAEKMANELGGVSVRAVVLPSGDRHYLSESDDDLAKVEAAVRKAGTVHAQRVRMPPRELLAKARAERQARKRLG